MVDFINEVREFYKPYYDKNDLAHSISHADDVCELALKMNRDCSKKLVVLSAYIHDIFNSIDRAKHHILAYEYVLKRSDKYTKTLDEKSLLYVAHAVLEHRSSFKGEFYSKLSEVISAADRGEPSLVPIIIRSMQFNNANADDVVYHIKDKYTKDGYAKFPKLYKEYFKDEFAKFQNDAKYITKEQVLKIWSSKNKHLIKS